MFWSKEQIAKVTMLVAPGSMMRSDPTPEWFGRRMPKELPFLTKAGAWTAWNRGSISPCFSLEPEEKHHVADVFTGFLVWAGIAAFALYAWWPALSRT